MYLAFVLSFFLAFTLIRTDDINYVKQLRTLLLKSSNYDKLSRPVHSENKSVKVAFDMVITQILELDLKREILTIDALMHMKWIDEYLTWNASKYGNVKKIRFTADEIWKPEIELWNTGTDIFTKDQYSAESEIIANANGSMYWMTPMSLSAHCTLDMTNWPNDEQECLLYLGIEEYRKSEVEFLPTFNRSSNKVWSQNNQYECSRVRFEVKNHEFSKKLSYSSVSMSMSLKRRKGNYFYFFTLPHILSITFAVMMFNFQIYSGVRALFAVISILLDLKVIFIIISQIGLHTYETPTLVKHIGFNLALIGLLLTCSILIRLNVSYLHSNVKCMRNFENSFLMKLLLFGPSTSTDLIENDLIKMIKNDQYTKLVQVDRQTLRKFSLLIQLTDRLLILIYCSLTAFMLIYS